MDNIINPDDPLNLVDKIVFEVKSQGLFDRFRKECMADVDTKPAYQNLRQRVENSVVTFLKDQKWSADLNKNSVREKLRKNIIDSGYLETGVERIVDQVVNPKITSVLLPQIEDVVCKYLGIDKLPYKNSPDLSYLTNTPGSAPTTSSKPYNTNGELKVETKMLLPDLLCDLEAVSPDSDTKSPRTMAEQFDDLKKEQKDEPMEQEEGEMDDIEDDDISPPFEPLESNQLRPVSSMSKGDSCDSHLSGISGLTSQDSIESEMRNEKEKEKVVEKIEEKIKIEEIVNEISNENEKDFKEVELVKKEEKDDDKTPVASPIKEEMKEEQIDVDEETHSPKLLIKEENSNSALLDSVSQDSQLSQVSSNSRLSIVTHSESPKMETFDTAEVAQTPKVYEPASQDEEADKPKLSFESFKNEIKMDSTEETVLTGNKTEMIVPPTEISTIIEDVKPNPDPLNKEDIKIESISSSSSSRDHSRSSSSKHKHHERDRDRDRKKTDQSSRSSSTSSSKHRHHSSSDRSREHHKPSSSSKNHSSSSSKSTTRDDRDRHHSSSSSKSSRHDRDRSTTHRSSTTSSSSSKHKSSSGSTRDRDHEKKSSTSSDPLKSKKTDDHASSRPNRNSEKRRSNDRDSNDGSNGKISSKSTPKRSTASSSATSSATNSKGNSPKNNHSPHNSSSSSSAAAMNDTSMLFAPDKMIRVGGNQSPPAPPSPLQPTMLPSPTKVMETPPVHRKVILDKIMVDGGVPNNIEIMIGGRAERTSGERDSGIDSTGTDELLNSTGKIKKTPKIADNIFEARSIIKMRRKLDKEEKRKVEEFRYFTEDEINMQSSRDFLVFVEHLIDESEKLNVYQNTLYLMNAEPAFVNLCREQSANVCHFIDGRREMIEGKREVIIEENIPMVGNDELNATGAEEEDVVGGAVNLEICDVNVDEFVLDIPEPDNLKRSASTIVDQNEIGLNNNIKRMKMIVEDDDDDEDSDDEGKLVIDLDRISKRVNTAAAAANPNNLVNNCGQPPVQRKLRSKTNAKANQCYSSDDLYKPRPVIGRSRRRGGDESNDIL